MIVEAFKEYLSTTNGEVQKDGHDVIIKKWQKDNLL